MIHTISETICATVLHRASGFTDETIAKIRTDLTELDTTSWARFCAKYGTARVHTVTEAIHYALSRRIDLTPWFVAIVGDLVDRPRTERGEGDRVALAALRAWVCAAEYARFGDSDHFSAEVDARAALNVAAMSATDEVGDLVGEVMQLMQPGDLDETDIINRVYRLLSSISLEARERHERVLGERIDTRAPSDKAVLRVRAAREAESLAYRATFTVADDPRLPRLLARAARLQRIADQAEATALGGGMPLCPPDYFDAIEIADQVASGDLKRTGYELTDRVREQALAPVRHLSRVRAAAATLALRTAASPPLQGSVAWESLDRWVVSNDSEAPMPIISGHAYWCAAFAARLEAEYQPSDRGPGSTVRTPACDFAARRQQASGRVWTVAITEAVDVLAAASAAAGEQPAGVLGELGYLMDMLRAAEAEAAERPTEHHDVLASAAMDHVRRVALSAAAESPAVGQCLDEVLSICQRLLAVTCPRSSRGILPPRPVRQLARLGIV